MQEAESQIITFCKCRFTYKLQYAIYMISIYEGHGMIPSDLRGARLRALDTKLVEFAADSEHAHDGAASLCELGIMIAGSMSSWNEMMRHVTVARPQGFVPEVAGIMVIESVFDELLDGPSLGLLVAAFELAVSTQ